jgi:hypothetical protein
MALRFAADPANGAALVRDHLNRISARRNPLSAGGVDFATLQVDQPHPVYDLGADAIAAGRGLAAAVFSGYRYMVSDGSAAVAAAEIQTDDQGNATRLTHVNTGPYVQATAQALTSVASHPEVSGGSYEIRLLRAAAIYVMALWLKPDSGGADILYPLSPAPAGLEAERPYSAADFMQAILPLAQQRSAKEGHATVP